MEELQMKKAFLAIVAAVTVFMVVQTSAHASTRDIHVQVNGQLMNFDVKPQLLFERTYVPFRKIFETLGADVTYDNKNESAIALKDGKQLIMPLNSSVVFSKSEDVAITPSVRNDSKALTLSYREDQAASYVVMRGAEVVYEGKNSKFTDKFGEQTNLAYTIEVYDQNHTILGVKQIQATKIDSPVAMVDSRVLVPVRYVSQALGADVDWKQVGQVDVVGITMQEKKSRNL